jgi:hypothetical protein
MRRGDFALIVLEMGVPHPLGYFWGKVFERLGLGPDFADEAESQWGW